MKRAEVLQGLRLMKFEEIYSRRQGRQLTQEGASELLGVSVRTFRRWEDRYESEGAHTLVYAECRRPVDWYGQVTPNPRKVLVIDRGNCMTARVLELATMLLLAVNPIYAQQVGEVVRVDTRLLNVRTSPGTDNAVSGRVAQGTLMTVEERNGDWIRLSDPMDRGLAEGWVNSRFLVAVAPSTGNSPAVPRSQPMPSVRYMPTPAPFAITDADFNCSEGLFDDDGFDACELEVIVEVNIPFEYTAFLKDYVDVTCEARVSYRTAGSYFEQSERESETVSLYLYSGIASETLELDFDFGYTFEPVVSAKVASLDCAPG